MGVWSIINDLLGCGKKKKAGEEEREKENPSYLFMTGACFIPKSVAKNENS